MTARRAARRQLLTGRDILPLDLMPLTGATDLFAAFTVLKPDGSLGMDPRAVRDGRQAEAVRKAGFDAWFAQRGISTTYLDHDARYEEVLTASRAHWGLNHQGQPTSGPSNN